MEVNYEPFYRSHPCWVDGPYNDPNVCVGISVPGPQF